MPLRLRLHYFILSAGVASTEKRSRLSGWQSPAKDGFDGVGFPVGPDWDEIPGAERRTRLADSDFQRRYHVLERRTAKVDRAALDPAHVAGNGCALLSAAHV